jgi:hydrogenase/urease accessory protein HupE
MPLASAARVLVVFLLLLLAFTRPVESVQSVAALASTSGFWDGLVDGFLSLPRLLASLAVDVNLVEPGAHLLSYDIGFYVGVLLLAGVGAAAASSTPETFGLNTRLRGHRDSH